MWIVLIFYVAKQFNGTLRTDRVSPDTLPWPQVMAPCVIFFDLNLNISITTIPHSMPRMLLNVSKAPKTSQMLLFCTPALSGSYDVWGGTHATNPLKTKAIYSTFTSYLTEMHANRCLARQVKRPSSLPTDPNQTDLIKRRICEKLEDIAFHMEIISHSNALGRDATTATPCGQNCATFQRD